MKLVLHYRGELFANGAPAHKHRLRQHFHRQLATLWQQKPLLEHHPHWLVPATAGRVSLLRPIPPFVFVPLISAALNAVAEVSLLLLRPEPPGALVTQGGDIDNRLKTLLDSLTMPRSIQALPENSCPGPDEQPHFFCLFEDDNLITDLSVRTEQLLEPGLSNNVVDLTIQIRTSVTRVSMANTNFL